MCLLLTNVVHNAHLIYVARLYGVLPCSACPAVRQFCQPIASCYDFLQKSIALVRQVSFQVACKISQCCIRARYHGCKTLNVFFLCVFLSVFFVVVVVVGVFDLVFVLFFFCLVVGMLLFLFPVWLRPTSLTSFQVLVKY